MLNRARTVFRKSIATFWGMSRGSENSAAGQLLESLESRQLLAADLGVTFDQSKLTFPAIVVPGDNVVPDSAFDAPIRIVNNGPQAAVGLVNIAFYLSADTVLNTSTDLLMREYRNEQLQLPVFTGDPNDIGEFSPDMRVPAEAVPGTYHIIVRITYPNSQIDDFNSANNIAVSDQTVEVQRRFGAVGTRTNITMVVKDAENTLIAFSLSGGGTGSLSIDSQGRYVVTTTGTGGLSDLSVQTNGGDGAFDFASVTINGAIRSFTAPNARLVGTFNPGTSITTLTLGNVIGPTTLTIPATSTSPTITLGAVQNLILSSGVGIKSLSVTSWFDTDSTPDVIQAPFLDAITQTSSSPFGAQFQVAERRIGNVDGRTNVSRAERDADGSLIVVKLTGPGSGTVNVDSQGRLVIDSTGTSTTSDLTISVRGGNNLADIGAVTIAGAIRSFVAPEARLLGTFSPASSIATLTLGDVVGGALTFPTSAVQPTITLGNVTDSAITSPGGITSLIVKSWNDSDSTADLIQSKFITTLRTLTGGNFNASLRISNLGAAGALSSVVIGGVIRGGTWVVDGPVGSISAFATAAAWSATVSRALGSLTINQSLRGVIAARSFGNISVGKDILATRILAGAYLGNDGLLGGSGGDADTFGVGRIDRLVVTRNVANSIIAAGLKSISGSGIEEPQQLLGGVNSRIGELRIGNVAAVTARFLANRYVGPTTIGGQAVDVRTNSRFQIVTQPPVATATNITVGSGGATITINFQSFGVINLNTITGAAVRVTGPNGFSQIATLASRRFLLGSLQATGVGVFTIAAPGGNWTPADDGEYSVQIVTNTVADSRGNFASAGEISQFLVSV